MKERGPPRVGAVPGLRLAADEVHATRTVIRRTERRTSWRLVVPGRWTPRATDAQLGKAMLGKIFELFRLSDRPFVLLISIILAVSHSGAGRCDHKKRSERIRRRLHHGAGFESAEFSEWRCVSDLRLAVSLSDTRFRSSRPAQRATSQMDWSRRWSSWPILDSEERSSPSCSAAGAPRPTTAPGRGPSRLTKAFVGVAAWKGISRHRWGFQRRRAPGCASFARNHANARHANKNIG